MSRSHRKPGVARIVCTDSYHRDTPEYAGHGHHYLGTLRLAWRPLAHPDDDGLRQHGPFAPLPAADDPGVTLMWSGAAQDAPVKDYRRPDGTRTFTFRCACGLNPQRNEAYLLTLLTRCLAANPGASRVDIDITTL